MQASGLVACILNVVYLRSIHNLGVNGDCVVLLLWRMLFDSQDFMGFIPDEALRDWELLYRFACDKLTGFFFNMEGKATFASPNMPVCVHRIILKTRCLQTHPPCIFTKML